MLTLYVTCLLIGGTFVAASAFLGGSEDGGGDLDHDGAGELDHDFDADHDLDVNHDLDGDAALVPVVGTGGVMVRRRGRLRLLQWLISLRFWSFFLAFFGLTGTVLQGLGLWSSAGAILAAALGMGLVSGGGVSCAIQRLREAEVDSAVVEQDYLGATGRVLLPVKPGGMGKVRLQIKGRTLDLPARTDEGEGLLRGREVFVYGVEDGVLQVMGLDRQRLPDGLEGS